MHEPYIRSCLLSLYGSIWSYRIVNFLISSFTFICLLFVSLTLVEILCFLGWLHYSFRVCTSWLLIGAYQIPFSGWCWSQFYQWSPCWSVQSYHLFALALLDYNFGRYCRQNTYFLPGNYVLVRLISNRMNGIDQPVLLPFPTLLDRTKHITFPSVVLFYFVLICTKLITKLIFCSNLSTKHYFRLAGDKIQR